MDWPKGDLEPDHVYVAHWRQEPNQGRTLRLSRGRWPSEQYFQRGKADLGLDQYEGRSWCGLQHRMVLSTLVYLFVVSEHQRAKKDFRPHGGSGAALERVLQVLRQ